MTESTVVRELLCQLTEAELRERGDSMADAELAIERLKIERRKLNAQIREQSDTRAELAQAIEARHETREVSCEWERQPKRKVWTLTRSDTCECIEERPMSEADMQEGFDFAAPSDYGGEPIAAIDVVCVDREDIGELPAAKPKRKRAAKTKDKPAKRKRSSK